MPCAPGFIQPDYSMSGKCISCGSLQVASSDRTKCAMSAGKVLAVIIACTLVLLFILLNSFPVPVAVVAVAATVSFWFFFFVVAAD